MSKKLMMMLLVTLMDALFCLHAARGYSGAMTARTGAAQIVCHLW